MNNESYLLWRRERFSWYAAPRAHCAKWVHCTSHCHQRFVHHVIYGSVLKYMYTCTAVYIYKDSLTHHPSSQGCVLKCLVMSVQVRACSWLCVYSFLPTCIVRKLVCYTHAFHSMCILSWHCELQNKLLEPFSAPNFGLLDSFYHQAMLLKTPTSDIM